MPSLKHFFSALVTVTGFLFIVWFLFVSTKALTVVIVTVLIGLVVTCVAELYSTLDDCVRRTP
jgi:hypothetical protein